MCNMFSLEWLCLHLIVQQFERFYFVFTVSKEEYVQRNFQFLQRRFSVQLTTALCMQKKLKEEYFEVLMNEYLTCLVGIWFKNTRYQSSMNGIFYRLPNVTRVCFKHCGDEILENVAKFCPKIVEIDVRRSNVSDNGVKYLCEIKNGMVPCPELKNLFIKSSRVTDIGAKRLIRSLSSLEKFDYPNLPLLLYSLNRENFPEWKSPYNHNLVELNLSEFPNLSYYAAVLKTCVTVCCNLESIACYILDKQELNFLTNSHLKKLCLEFRIRYSKVNMYNFLQTKGYNLSSLKISNHPYTDYTSCSISVTVLAVNCPVLKEFYAHNVNFTVDDDDDCVQIIFPSLIKGCFSLINSSATKALCLLLSSSPKLESLSIRFISELPLELKSKISIWCKSPSAKVIEFIYIANEEGFFADILLNSPSLKAMFLNRCKFYVHDINSFLRSFAEKLRNKPRIFVKEYDPWGCDVEDTRYMYIINYDSLFNENIHDNLENYLKEEYKYSSIYDSLFIKTALFLGDSYYYSYCDSAKDWEDTWKVISF